MITLLTKYSPHVAVLALSLFFIISLRLAWVDSLTFDETAHIPAGYSYVTLSDHRLNPEHPPLIKALSGLALLPMLPVFDTTQEWWTTSSTNGEYNQWTAGYHFLHAAGNNTDFVTFFARITIVAISTLFGAFLFFWGRRLSGNIGGSLTVLLYTLSPNVLGHNHFVTTDIGASAAITIGFFAIIYYVKNPSWRNVFIVGSIIGLAQTVKFSALLLVPFFIGSSVLYPLLKIHASKNVSRFMLTIKTTYRALVSVFVGILVIWAIYMPLTMHMPTEVLQTITPIKLSGDDTRNVILRNSVLYLNDSIITRPLATYIHGVGQVLNRIDDGNVTYFFGTVSSNANPLYFPTVFMIKESLPHIIFIIVGIIISFTSICSLVFRNHRSNNTFIHSLRAYFTFHVTEVVLISFIFFYFYISVTGNLTIGYRHLFPIIPLVYLLSSIAVVRIFKKYYNGKCSTKYISVGAIILLIMMFLNIISSYPYYLSYFNQSVNGSKNGYKFITDSNSDWGQDLKRLNIWINDYNNVCSIKVKTEQCRYGIITKIRTDYFGGGHPSNRLNERFVPWHDSKRPIEKGWYAISVNSLQNSLYDTNKTSSNSYQYLRGRQPYYQVGTSILVYYIDAEDSAR